VPAPRAEIAGKEGRFFTYDSDETPVRRSASTRRRPGTKRDTLGPAHHVGGARRSGREGGLEEGNRIAAINSVSLRANAADIEDYESASTLSRRLVRELEKAKPGDEVELRVYREGRTQAIRVRTVSSDSLFKRATTFRRVSREDMDERPALGFGLGTSGSRRDTLGVLVMSVQDSSPAARAGLEEGNRIAAINGVNLRVAREDAEDQVLARAKAQRLMREVSQLKPGDNVTLRVYANGQYRDVTMKVARAGDLPHSRGMTFFGGWDVPGVPADGAHAAAARAVVLFRTMDHLGPIRLELGPELDQSLEGVRMQLDQLRPELDRIRTEVPRALKSIEVPRVRVEWGRGVEIEGCGYAGCGMRDGLGKHCFPRPSRIPQRASRTPHNQYAPPSTSAFSTSLSSARHQPRKRGSFVKSTTWPAPVGSSTRKALPRSRRSVLPGQVKPARTSGPVVGKIATFSPSFDGLRKRSPSRSTVSRGAS
jgi:hypothetical protein